MPLVSIVMPCYNAAEYLRKSINSVLGQTFTDWELIIANDGSTDMSACIANEMAYKHTKIRYVEKKNGGVASARNFGYKFISKESKYVIFYDADDIMHANMLAVLVRNLEDNASVGAAYCDYMFIDKADAVSGKLNMPRYVATSFWYKVLPDSEMFTPFESIICWTQMFESLTLIRRKAYDETKGWDEKLDNIGEGVDLFSEIALNWNIQFINSTLYYYRRYESQVTNVPQEKIKKQGDKVIEKWENKFIDEKQRRKLKRALVLYKYRLPAIRILTQVKISARNVDIVGIARNLFSFFRLYILSLPLMMIPEEVGFREAKA
jgi:glycosyltransferase involved in cell wall biosynthesis